MQLIICGWLHKGNEIRYEGAMAMGESLKENKTLAQLDLQGTSSFRGWIDVCMGVYECS